MKNAYSPNDFRMTNQFIGLKMLAIKQRVIIMKKKKTTKKREENENKTTIQQWDEQRKISEILNEIME